MPPKKSVAVAVRSNALTGERCIVTGEIPGQSRKSAEHILKDAGATIEKSLNKKVTLLVLGDKAGDDKLSKAKDMGTQTIPWSKILKDIQSGKKNDEDNEDQDDDEEEEEEKEEEEAEVEEPKPKKSKAASKDTAKAAPKTTTKTAAKPAPKPTKSKAADSKSSAANPVDGKTVIVTGTIPGHERKEVSGILEDAGATVAKSLNKSVELVIVGTKPGPDKLQKVEDLGIETIEWEEVAKALDIEVTPQKNAPDVKAGGAPSSVDGMTLLITGEIDGHTRSSAQKVLEQEGAKFAKSLNSAVQLVVLGINAGPDKLEKIAEKGIDTCNWDDLINKLDIDAGAPPKKKARKN